MAYNYLDYLSEDYKRYNNSLVYLSIFIVISLVAGVLSLNWYISNESDFLSYSSKITKIEIITIEESSHVPYDFNKAYKKALKVELSEKVFYIVEMHQEKWSDIISDLKPGTRVHILYKVFNKKKEIVDLKSDDKSYIKLESIKNNSFYAILVISTILTIFIGVLITLIRKRKNLQT